MKKKKKKLAKKKPPYDDRDDPNHGDGLNDSQRAAQDRFHNHDSLGGETGRYLDMMGEE